METAEIANFLAELLDLWEKVSVIPKRRNTALPAKFKRPQEGKCRQRLILFGHARAKRKAL